MAERVDFVLKGQRVHTGQGFQPLAVVARGGKIVALTSLEDAPPARETYDAGSHPVLPGIIDPHTHMRDPGHTHREDWKTGTRAGAAGGVTCVLEHPNAVPPVNSAGNFRLKREIAAAQAYIDFGLFGGVGDGTVDRMEEQAREGAIAFKTFLWPYPDRSDEFAGIYTIDDGVLYQIFERAAALGLPACVHAESYTLVRMFSERMKRAGKYAPIHHEQSRPVVAELEAVWRTMVLAREANTRLNLLHISSGSAATAAKMWRAMHGMGVTVETCPTYLTLTADRMGEIGPYAKINPPLRSIEEQALLWERVADGTIDTISSDHGPHEFAAKERGWHNIFDAPAGAPGVETSLPIMLTHVNNGRLTLERLVELMSANVAHLYGLYGRKGVIAVGSDADLVVVDMALRRYIEPSQLHTKDPRVARMFEGFETLGAPILTVVRGRPVMRDGEIVGEPGYGMFVSPLR
ncbi:MAG: amidohydrolase family protein [Ardenticatenaceae bacterium]|nr:amidohydrolase family protein [Ardenticatenaceae bacterium]